MRLREVLTYIFVDVWPNRPHRFLDGNAIKCQGEESLHSVEYLKAHDENQLFHILFDDYDDLNQNPVAKPQQLLQLIKDNQTYDKLREMVSEAPIKSARHSGFLASLKELIPSIEAARNGIAHNRELSVRSRQDYEQARPKLLTAIDEFWKSEAAVEQLPEPEASNFGESATPAEPDPPRADLDDSSNSGIEGKVAQEDLERADD